jgi:hypothetical protein
MSHYNHFGLHSGWPGFSTEQSETSSLAKKICVDLMKALIKKDASGFEKAFSCYLSLQTYFSHVPAQRHFHGMLCSALELVNQEPENEGHIAHGNCDVLLRAPGGYHYLIELKYMPGQLLKPQSDGTPASSAKDKLRLKMSKLADRAMTQIEKKYAVSFRKPCTQLVMIALVVSGRMDVLVKIKEIVNRY